MCTLINPQIHLKLPEQKTVSKQTHMVLFSAAFYLHNNSAIIVLCMCPWKAFSANQQFLRPIIGKSFCFQLLTVFWHERQMPHWGGPHFGSNSLGGGMGDFGIDCFIVVNMVTFMMAGPSDRKQTFNFLSYHLSELQVLFQILIKSSPACMSFLTFLLSM